MNKYRFYRKNAEWFVDLPEYIEQGGSPDNLEMVEGADTMLDLMAEGGEEVILGISTEKFDGGDQLVLKEICSPMKGGAIYFMALFEGKETNLTLWLCQVVEFVFGNVPTKLFVQRDHPAGKLINNT